MLVCPIRNWLWRSLVMSSIPRKTTRLMPCNLFLPEGEGKVPPVCCVSGQCLKGHWWVSKWYHDDDWVIYVWWSQDVMVVWMVRGWYLINWWVLSGEGIAKYYRLSSCSFGQALKNMQGKVVTHSEEVRWWRTLMVECVTFFWLYSKENSSTFHDQSSPPSNFFRMCNHFL